MKINTDIAVIPLWYIIQSCRVNTLSVRLGSPWRLSAVSIPSEDWAGCKVWTHSWSRIRRETTFRKSSRLDLNELVSFSITGQEVRRLMRLHKTTIKDLCMRLSVSKKRVQAVRAGGVNGYGYCRDWLDAIENVYPSNAR